MTRAEFEKLKKDPRPNYLKGKVSVNDGASEGYISHFHDEHIEIQFEGPIPEPFHYTEVELKGALDE